MSAVAKYIKGLLEQGQHHFTTEDAVQALGGDRKPIARALKRLISKGELASPLQLPERQGNRRSCRGGAHDPGRHQAKRGRAGQLARDRGLVHRRPVSLR